MKNVQCSSSDNERSSDGKNSAENNSNPNPSLASSSSSPLLLVFDGVKMPARILLNGKLIGHTNDQFLRYIFPVPVSLLRGKVLCDQDRAAGTSDRDGHQDNLLSVVFYDADTQSAGSDLDTTGDSDGRYMVSERVCKIIHVCWCFNARHLFMLTLTHVFARMNVSMPPSIF